MKITNKECWYALDFPFAYLAYFDARADRVKPGVHPLDLRLGFGRMEIIL